MYMLVITWSDQNCQQGTCEACARGHGVLGRSGSLTAGMELGGRGWRADMEGDHFCFVLLPALALLSTERSSIYSKVTWPISRSQTQFCNSVSCDIPLLSMLQLRL